MRLGRIGVLVALAAVTLWATPASAQTVLNPTTVEFVPSSDHSAVEADGTTPVVTRYEVRMYLEADPTTAIVTQDIGKPAPVAGKIAVVNPVWFAGLTPRTRYVARVAAIGGGGAGLSAASLPFGLASVPTPTPPPEIR